MRSLYCKRLKQLRYLLSLKLLIIITFKIVCRISFSFGISIESYDFSISNFTKNSCLEKICYEKSSNELIKMFVLKLVNPVNFILLICKTVYCKTPFEYILSFTTPVSLVFMKWLRTCSHGNKAVQLFYSLYY